MNFDKENYSKQYDGIAGAYREFSSSNKEITYVAEPLLMELIGDIDNRVILDIGCGSGSHLSILRGENPKALVGTDISENLVSLARQSLSDDVKLMVANANSEDFVDVIQSGGISSFDVIYHSFVQVHNTNLHEMTIFWRNIYRLLRNGGKAIGITSDPNAVKSVVGVDKLMGLRYEFPGEDYLQDGDFFKAYLSPKVTVVSCYWTFSTVAKIMNDIGFKDVKQVFVHDNDTSARVFSKNEWDIIEKSGVVYALSGMK